jgi:hypothetical protein
MKGGRLKKVILALLSGNDFESELKDMCRYQPKRMVSYLLSFFYNKDQLVRWRAITAAGIVVSDLALNDMESARVVMRRLMWNLNDESGGIGWGSPEAMGEIMARNKHLASEYHRILVSYLMQNGNYLDNKHLQEGVLWGIGRLAECFPDLVREYLYLIIPFMQSEYAAHRGLSAWIAKRAGYDMVKSDYNYLLEDNSKMTFYSNGRLIACTVSQIASDTFLSG